MKIIMEITKKEINTATDIACQIGMSADPLKDTEELLSTEVTIQNNLFTSKSNGLNYTLEFNEDFFCRIMQKAMPIIGICQNVYCMCKSFFNEIYVEMGETKVSRSKLNNDSENK